MDNVTETTVRITSEKFWETLMKNIDEGVLFYLEATVHRCSAKNLFLKTSQYLQENTYVGVSFSIKLNAEGNLLVFP